MHAKISSNTIPIQFVNTTPRAHDMIGSSHPNSISSKVRDRARRQTEPQWHMTSAEEAGFEHPGKVPILRVGLRWGHRIRLIADGIWVCIAKCMSLTTGEQGLGF